MFFVQSFFAFSQSTLYEQSDLKFGINGGVSYGGPIPTKATSDVSGNPTFGPFLGLYADYVISKDFHLQPNLNLSIKGINIFGNFVKDTLVEIDFGGQSGYIPTFYTADVQGAMNLIYLDLPVFFTYGLFDKSYMFLGAQASLLIGGEYYTDVHVVVGEGGFYDDVEEHFDMYPDVNTYDFAVCLGAAYKIFNDLAFKVYATRSFVPFNKPGTGNPDLTGNLYNTYFMTSLVYDF